MEYLRVKKINQDYKYDEAFSTIIKFPIVFNTSLIYTILKAKTPKLHQSSQPY